MPSIYHTMRERAGSRRSAADSDARRTRTAYEGAVTGFDPMAYMAKAAEAGYGEVAEEDATRRHNLNVSNNARGFGRSVVGQAGTERTFAKQLARMLGSLSMQAGQMEQNRQGMLGDLAESDETRADDYFGAEVDIGMTQKAQQLQERASKRAMWGQIVGGGLSALGAWRGGK